MDAIELAKRRREKEQRLKQQRLGFEHTEREKLAMIRSLSSIDCSLSAGRLRGVQKLVETLYVRCSDGHVSHARVATIAEKMIGGPVSTSTVASYRRDAEGLRLIRVENKTIKRYGRRPNVYRIEWRRLADLVQRRPPKATPSETPDRPAETGDRPADSADRATDSGDRPADSAAPYRGIGPSLGPSLSPPPPPSSSKSGNDSSAWGEVAAELFRLGLKDIGTPLRQAKAAGVSSRHVLELVEHYQSLTRQWRDPLKVLHYRIRTAMPGIPAYHGWPAEAGSSTSTKAIEDDVESIRYRAYRHYQKKGLFGQDLDCAVERAIENYQSQILLKGKS